MRRFLFSLMINLIFIVPVFADYVEDRSMSLAAGDITEMEIDCGAGYLFVEGVEGLENIEVEAEIIVEGMRKNKAADYVDRHLRLELTEKRGNALLRASFDKSLSSFNFFSSRSAVVNLVVRVPKKISMDIDDGSGDTRIENIDGDVRVDDGSGDLELERITGLADIDDGSGGIDIFDIGGSVMIDDGSGEIRVKQVGGDVEIDDGSGDIMVRKIGGSVAVDDGSGDIRIRYVEQDVEIIDDSSGDVRIAHVDGRVKR